MTRKAFCWGVVWLTLGGALISAGGASAQPTNEWIAFTRRVNAPSEPLATEIWLIRSNGTGAKRLVRNGQEPCWSPDGKFVAFVREGQLWRVPLDGGDERKLAELPERICAAPRYNRTGDRLIFVGRDLGEENATLFLARSDGSSPEALEAGTGYCASPDFAADGASIFYLSHGMQSGETIVYRVALETKQTKSLHHPERESYFDCLSLSLSPDAKQLACATLGRKDIQDNLLPAQGVILLKADGSAPRTLYSGDAGRPSWSPDNANLVFSTPDGLRLLHLPTRKTRLLYRGNGVRDAVWQPSSKK